MNKQFFVAALVLSLAACSSTDEVNIEPADLVDFKQSVELDELWSKDIGSGQDDAFSRISPAIDGDVIYVAGSAGEVVALNRDSGKVIWEVDLDRSLSGGVGAYEDLVLVGTYKGQVLALNSSDGSLKWTAQASSEILAAPQSNGSVVVAQSLDGRLFGYDVETGEQIWRYDNKLPVLTLRGTATPVLWGATVYAGFASGKVIALNAADGVVKWEQRVTQAQGKTELERVIDIDGSPLLVGDILYVSSYQGKVIALNRANGRQIWAQDSSSHQNISASSDLIFVAGDDDTVRALRIGNGQQVWENDQMTRRELAATQTFGDYVAVTDFEGYLHVLDNESGRFVARDRIDSDGVRAAMISADGVLYVYGNSGELVALTIK